MHNANKTKTTTGNSYEKQRSAWSARVIFPVDFGHWIKTLIFENFSTDSERLRN